MIGFDGIIRVLLGDVAGGGQQLIEHARIRGSPVGAYLGRAWAVLKRASEKPASSREVPLLCDEDVDDLANWSIARYRYIHRPAIFTYVSSTNHRSPGACRQGRAASISSGANRCTQR